MRKRGLKATVGCVAALSLALGVVGAAPAGAATQVGNPCVASTAGVGYTIYGLSQVGSPYPLTVPGAGVITRWTMNTISFEVGPITQTLKVLRPTGGFKQTLVVGESSTVTSGGLSSTATRISVQAGDHLGITGSFEGEAVGLLCETPSAGDIVGAIPGNPPVGTTGTILLEEGNLAVPIVATVEPDADNDGFGDETQDQCPQAALVQGPCPTVAVEASSVIKRKSSVVLLVSTNAAAPVKVTGTAKLGKGKKAKLSSKAQTVVPGKVSRFTLKFPKRLKNKLEDLQRKRSLQLQLTATATDLIGRVTTDKLKTRLKGQASPKGK